MIAKRKQNITRGFIYVFGVITLALGISLNTKTGLGVAPITSVAYSTSHATGIIFSVCIFSLYTLMLIAELIIKGKDRNWIDYLQLPFSFAFSLLLDVYDRFLVLEFPHLWQNILLLMAAVVFTGAGVSMTVNTRLVANPADALVKAIADRAKKDMGLVKNILDIGCVCTAMVIDLCAGNLWVSVGVGTVLTMILVGRAVYMFNRLFLKKMLRASGLE